MFDIFVYLFETYFHADAYPEPERLAQKLSVVGFEQEDISDALEWLAGLRHPVAEQTPASTGSIRLFSPDELLRLSTECRSFLMLLENAGATTPSTRELIIERAMALANFRITLSRFKLICLMVLWSRDEILNSLILEELLGDDDVEVLQH